MQSMLARKLTWALGIAAVLGFTVQTAEGQPPPPPQQQQAIDVDDETLEKFVEAYLDVTEISRELETELGQVGNDVEQAQQIQQEYANKMNEAVEDRDLEVEEYRQIVNAINTDADLRGRFAEVLQKVHEEREPRR